MARAIAVGSSLSMTAACFDPSPPSGLPCGPLGACPGGLECNAATTTCDPPRGGDAPTGGDAPLYPIDATIDGVPADANPMAIEVSFGESGDATFSGVTADTTLETGIASNRGAEDHTSVQDASWEGLYRFDVSAIAGASSVVAARLVLSTADDVNLLRSGSAQLYRMREDWDEATATYFSRRTGQPWTAMGADPPSRDDTPLGKFTPDADDVYSVALPTDMIADWIADPALNAGVIIETTNAAVGHLHLGSKEGAAARMPLLVVEYIP